MPNKFFINLSTKIYDEILARVNLSVLRLRRLYLDAAFLSNVSVSKISRPRILNIVGLWVRPKNNQRSFYIHCSFCAKTRPVTAAKGVCSKIDISNHHDNSLRYPLLSNTNWLNYYCIPTIIPTVHTIFRYLFLSFINFLISAKWPGVILQSFIFLFLYFVLYRLWYLPFSYILLRLITYVSSPMIVF